MAGFLHKICEFVFICANGPLFLHISFKMEMEFNLTKHKFT